MYSLFKWKLELGGDGGHESQKASNPQQPTMPPARGPSVEAECMGDDRVFTDITHIPE